MDASNRQGLSKATLVRIARGFYATHNFRMTMDNVHEMSLDDARYYLEVNRSIIAGTFHPHQEVDEPASKKFEFTVRAKKTMIAAACAGISLWGVMALVMGGSGVPVEQVAIVGDADKDPETKYTVEDNANKGSVMSANTSTPVPGSMIPAATQAATATPAPPSKSASKPVPVVIAPNQPETVTQQPTPVTTPLPNPAPASPPIPEPVVEEEPVPTCETDVTACEPPAEPGPECPDPVLGCTP